MDERGQRRAAAAVAALHVAVAGSHAAFSGVRLAASEWLSWNAFWQVLPIELLDEYLGRALWNLHMQPPLWNLFGALLRRLFGDAFYPAMHVVHVALGALLSAMLFRLLVQLTARPRLSLGVALLFALNPALFLYEAYALYPLLVAFLITWLVWLVGRFQAGRSSAALLGAVVVANALVLTRSLYHPLLVGLVAAGATALAAPRRARFAGLALLVSLPTALWVVKNEVRFGVGGTSSWFGQNLWRTVSSNYSREELARLAEGGIVAPAAARLWAFSRPFAYREYGFARVAGVPELDGDHLNNINIIAISRMYGASAIRLLRHDGVRGLRGSARSVLVYTAPESRFPHLMANRLRIAWHDRVYSGWLLGDDWLRIPGDLGASGPVFALLALTGAVTGARRIRAERRAAAIGWLEWARLNPTVSVAALLVGYNFAVGCLFDFGENQRFKFEVVALWWLLIAWALSGGSHLDPRRRERPESA